MATVVKQRRPVKGKARKKRPAKKGAQPKAAPSQSSPGSNGAPPVAGVVYGPPGVGKTDFCANWPDARFVIDEHEVGIKDLVAFGRTSEPQEILTASNFDDVIESLHRLSREYRGGTTVVDSATGMQNMCFEHCCMEEYDDDWSVRGFYSYQQGPQTAVDRYWEPKFIGALNRCLHAGHNVLVVAHSEIKRYEDPESTGYERYTPYLHKRCWQSLHRWAGMVLFYNYYVQVVKEPGQLKAKPNSATEERQIYTAHTAAYDAKNRYGLPPVIQAGDSGEEAYGNFIEAYRRCLKS